MEGGAMRKEMTDKEFLFLKEELQRTYDEHWRLQIQHIKLTSCRWVPESRFVWPKKSKLKLYECAFSE